MATDTTHSAPCTVKNLSKIAQDEHGQIRMPSNAFDQVYPNLIIGDKTTALDKGKLKKLGITHIVNCAQGHRPFGNVDTTEEYYKDSGIHFFAIAANDVAGFNIMPFLEPTANHIDQALKSGGKVLVHCCEGFSRAPTVVTSYLMHHQNMDVRDALKQVRSKREVCPNGGFMKILCALNASLEESRGKVY